MDFQVQQQIQKCFDNNKSLIDTFSVDIQTSPDDIMKSLVIVGKHPDLVDMAGKINQVMQSNPRAAINFGDYGANIANKLKLEQDLMYRSLIVAGHNELLLSIVKQISAIFKAHEENQ